VGIFVPSRVAPQDIQPVPAFFLRGQVFLLKKVLRKRHRKKAFYGIYRNYLQETSTGNICGKLLQETFTGKEQIWKATVCIFPVTPSDMACMKKSGRSAETTERVP
jgi:hypothetical protein